VSLPRRREVLGWLARTITIVSAVLRPVGPLQGWVYWVRRAVVLGVIVAIVVVLVLVLSGGSSKPPATHHHTPPAPTTSASTSPTATAVAACDPSVLKLVMSTGIDVYPTGQSPKLIATFTNSGTVSCTLDLRPSQQVWTVSSGADQIWATTGCTKAAGLKGKQETITAGGTKTVSAVWDGHRIDPGCAEGDVALPGTYHLHGTLAGVTGQPATFHISS
jgi:hypothetical protein